MRLDGIDVQPTGNTTITLDPNGPHVSSDGPVTVWIDGIPAWKSAHFGMTFSGGAGGAVSDIESGSASTGITPNLFGWPINIGTGNPVGNNGGTVGVPWIFSPGITTISLQAQVGPRFPATMQAQWNFGDGKFERPGPNGQPEGVQSVALQGTVELTNRRGMQFGGCFAPFNDKQLKLFGADAGLTCAGADLLRPKPDDAALVRPGAVRAARRRRHREARQRPALVPEHQGVAARSTSEATTFRRCSSSSEAWAGRGSRSPRPGSSSSGSAAASNGTTPSSPRSY